MDPALLQEIFMSECMQCMLETTDVLHSDKVLEFAYHRFIRGVKEY